MRPFAIGVLTLVAAALPLQAQLPIVLTHVNVVDLSFGGITPDVSVSIRAGLIERIAPDLDAPVEAAVIDATGKFLIPGLWNMHVHLAEPESSFHALIANGITSVRDMYSGREPAAYNSWRTHPDAVRIAVAGMIAGPEGPSSPGVIRVDNAEDARLAVQLFSANRADFITLDKRIARDVYFAVADETRRLGKHFAGSVPDSVTPEEAAKAGQLSKESLARCNDADTQLFETFAENGMFLTPLLVESKRSQKIVKELHEAGVHLLAGSGTAPSGAGLHEELELLVASGLTPLEALQTATVNPAMYFGMLSQIGRVEQGKGADLVLLDANPLDDIRNTRKISAVFVRGKYYPLGK